MCLFPSDSEDKESVLIVTDFLSVLFSKTIVGDEVDIVTLG